MEPTGEQFSEWLTTAMEGKDFEHMRNYLGDTALDVARLAYAAGADAELEACCEWLKSVCGIQWARHTTERLRAARRPKPPSLKQQALEALSSLQCQSDTPRSLDLVDKVRNALAALPDD